ncbi:Aspartyl/glutamyl-tRNA(Asn/Gln) amidotransferase subunit B [Rickettsiales bacterium Ac37b]|nr:Aspartyl/glutamyl-tRNA(Asn/Gln) amidotransferase subunit B [Rickettsiales bacterium Ac37b]
MNLIQGKTGKWELIIGLEIHAQVASESKLFSEASTKFGAAPNTQVSLIDAAFPGMLPVINAFCVEQAVKTGLGLQAKINLKSAFDRKNYFYPDLPSGYQISQFSYPIVGHGKVSLDMSDGPRDINIERIHLEQDAGKSLHDQHPDYSFIDLNRAGIALMEIVTEPDLRSSAEAGEFMRKLRILLRYLGTCDGDMEKGSLRCDANVSVRKPGEKLGIRCEIKNLNSIRNIENAIDYEASRQIEILENGGKIDQETRLFDADQGITRLMRSKEDAQDYRYFPDPDLLPLELTEEFVNNIARRLPELPDQKKLRYINDLGLSSYDAEILVENQEVADYFEEVIKTQDPKLASNWITAELFGRLKKYDQSINDTNITPHRLAELLDLLSNEVISGKLAKQVFDLMFETNENPISIVKKHGLQQVTDQNTISKIVEEVLAANVEKVQEYQSGKDKLFGFFVGQVMKLSNGKANPELVNQELKEQLSK